MTEKEAPSKVVLLLARITYFIIGSFTLFAAFDTDEPWLLFSSAKDSSEWFGGIIMLIIGGYITFSCVKYVFNRVSSKTVDYVIISVGILFTLLLIFS